MGMGKEDGAGDFIPDTGINGVRGAQKPGLKIGVRD